MEGPLRHPCLAELDAIHHLSKTERLMVFMCAALDAVGGMFLLDNKEKCKKTEILNHWSQATLGVSLDENAVLWIDFVNQSSHQVDCGLLRTSSLHQASQFYTELASVGSSCFRPDR